MLNKKKKSNNITSAKSNGSTHENEHDKSRPVPTSLVAFGMIVVGDVDRNERHDFNLHVDGKIEGNVKANQVVVNETGNIEGNIVAATVVVKGRFTGQISAENIEVGPSAAVTGELLYDNLVIEQANINATLKKRQGGDEDKVINENDEKEQHNKESGMDIKAVVVAYNVNEEQHEKTSNHLAPEKQTAQVRH